MKGVYYMFSYLTNYGELKEISLCSTYSDNQLRDCVLNERSELITPLGILVPQYEHTGIRRKHTYSVSFFPNGKISRIALHEQTKVETPIGKLPAELITFYENGSIKKLFPLNGHISGYWNEDDEYNLAEEFCFDFPFGSIKTKIIGIGFYENGAVRSVTLWPNEVITINTPIGEQMVRIGFSLYPDGSLQSFEPARPIKVMTPIGLINSFDANANGISGDKNSLNFYEDGNIKSLITSSTKIIATVHNNIVKVHSPIYIREMYESEIFFRPLEIDFEKDKVRFNKQDEYKMEECSFKVEPYVKPSQSKCSDCSSCRQCSSGPLQIV
jgi:antitoxin component YwqK of YwqJK toxin-antitoxin module